MRKPLIAGNWKMNCGPDETRALLQALKKQLTEEPEDIEILVCPPSVSIIPAINSVEGTPVQVGAQNVFYKDNGAYTGEISTNMLSDVSCEYVIVGHSERREYFAETDEIVNQKTAKIIEAGMKAIVCVGESLEQRQDNEHEKVVTNQVEKALENIENKMAEDVVVAYEPIWAIGTGETATPNQADTMHKVIRDKLKKMYGEKLSESTRILYGGSMKPHNANELLSQPNVDGGLIGGASLKADSFTEIIEIAEKIES